METVRCKNCFREHSEAVCPHCGGAQNEDHQLTVGTILRDRYQIGKVLGQGGFGITYLAWDLLMHNTVAIKEFYPSGTVFRRSKISTTVECGTRAMIPQYEYSKERFLREAAALVKFQHIPQIVGIQDFVKDNNTAYIVMEFVKGVDLARYIQAKGGRLSVEETFRILRPVMEALAMVHKSGIVHRDISPDNIILEPMGGAKLLDFGAVRVVENPDVEKGLNKSTEAILKHGFAPLEQYNTRGSLGPWTDEYAMCATVWYCLTGTIPEEASVRMLEGTDPDWSSIEGLPVHQQKALQKGISSRAKDRYPSMDAFLEDMFPAKAAPPPPPEKEPVPQKKHSDPPSRKSPALDAPVPVTPFASPAKKGGRNKIRLILGSAAAVLAIVLAAALIIAGPGRLHGETEKPAADNVINTSPAQDDDAVIAVRTEAADYLQAETLLAEGQLSKAAIAFGKLAGYSDARERSFEIWDQIARRNTVDAGDCHTVALRADGIVVAVGNSNNERCDVNGWLNMVAVSAGNDHTVGVTARGTVIAAGKNSYDRCNVEDWTDIVTVCAGVNHTVGLKADGTVVAVGSNGNGQCNVEGWTDIVAISAGSYHTVGLTVDGTVVAVGYDNYGQCNVADWTDIVAVAAGNGHTVGLKADGTLVAEGWNDSGQCDVEGWTQIVSVSAGYYHTVGLKADGTVVAVGDNYFGQREVDDWTDIVAVAAGNGHTVGLKADGTLVAACWNNDGRGDVDDWTNIMLPKELLPFR